jgi:hypothetical protein
MTLLVEDDALALSNRAIAQLQALLLDQARSIAQKKRENTVTRDDVQEALATLVAAAFLEHLIASVWTERRTQAQDLLNAWMKDDSGYDQRIWPGLSADIDKHRTSERKRISG